MSIYKAYDIRGVYPDELNEEIVENIAKAFILKTQTKKIVVGTDKRSHSPSLVKAAVKGLTGLGANVIEIGLCTTPMFYFAVSHLKADAGFMITASHNPAKYNGIKMTLHDAVPFGGEDIQELQAVIHQNIFPKPLARGKVTQKNILKNYKKKILSFAEIKKPLKVVIDTGNGMCGLTVPEIFQELPLKTTYLYKKIDLTFPNHEANPLKTETLQDLQKEVKKQKADLGLAFDGDGDRAGFVDEKGSIVPMDLVIALIADQMPKKKIAYDIRSSKIVREVIEKNKGTPVPTRVGHYFIKKTMREQDISFAGELSGHFYFKELSYTDSAILASIKLMNILNKENKPFSEVIKPYQKYAKTDEINFEVQDKDKKIKQIENYYRDAKISKIDGITVEYTDWWFNLRKSNTEPLLRLNLEADTKELMEQKLKEITALIKQ